MSGSGTQMESVMSREMQTNMITGLSFSIPINIILSWAVVAGNQSICMHTQGQDDDCMFISGVMWSEKNFTILTNP